MSKQLQDKVAIITGSGGGLGAAIARTFLTAGASVVICDINRERVDATVAALSALGPVLGTTVDVSSEASVDELFAAATKQFGKVDILVNNAGVMDRFDPVGELAKDLWDRVIGVNLTGSYLCSRAAVRAMLPAEEPAADAAAAAAAAEEEAKLKALTGGAAPPAAPPTRGIILNIGSVGGIRGGVAGAAYTASKHGLIGLAKNTAANYAARGIRCNVVLPGGMATNIGDVMANGLNMAGFGVAQATMAVKAPVNDLGDMGELCLWLCSGQSRVLNGAVIAADGGWTAA